jgi:hypothetical protein
MLFDPRALGPPARTSIGGLPAELRLPGGGLSGAEHDLRPPELTRPLEGVANYHDWGFVPRWNRDNPEDCKVQVKAVVMALASRPLAIAKGIDAYDNLAIRRWLRDVAEWVEVVAAQDLDHNRPIGGVLTEGFDAWNVMTGHRVPEQYNRGTYHERPGRPLSRAEWLWVLAKVELSETPSAAHLWLTNARAELRRNRLRHSVMEAATVIESSVWTLLKRLGPSAVAGADQLSLGGLVGRASQRGIAIPKGFQKPDRSLLDCRNNAMHRDGIEPTRADAARIIEVATELLGRVEPLGAPRALPT